MQGREYKLSNARLQRIENRLDKLVDLLNDLWNLQKRKDDATMKTMEELVASVARQKTVTESVLVAIAGLRERMVEQGVPDEVIAEIDANTNLLADAIKENTPVAEEPPAVETEMPMGDEEDKADA